METPFRIKTIMNWNKSQQEKIKVVIGHFAWGIHQRISSRECHYISFIRDPLSRILSEFWYARNAARIPCF